MKRTATFFGVVLALLALLVALPQQAQAASKGLSVPVTGTFEPSDTPGKLSSIGSGLLTGTYTIESFRAKGLSVEAVGKLAMVLVDGDGATHNLVVPNVAIPVVTDAPATAAIQQLTSGCEVLDLELGPLDLDLLGLTIHLDRINLEIVAQPGSGNLLGNLLCAIVGLFDGIAAGLNLFQQLASLLNQLLGILG
jgi:hypothetical protein